MSAFLIPKIKDASFLLLATDRANLNIDSLHMSDEYLNKGKLNSFPLKPSADANSFNVISSSSFRNLIFS